MKNEHTGKDLVSDVISGILTHSQLVKSFPIFGGANIPATTNFASGNFAFTLSKIDCKFTRHYC